MGIRLTFLQHEDLAPAGHLATHAGALGLEIDTVRIDRGDPLPDLGGVDALIPLGSFASAADDRVPWLAGELELLRRADEAGVAILGVCFGGQALARALGGRVAPLERPEIGWLELDTDDPALVPPGPVVAWHNDALFPPPAATEVARTARASHAFTVGRHLGVQFHPEVTAGIVDAWAQRSPDILERAGVDASTVLDPLRREADANAARAGRLLRRFLERAGLGTLPPTAKGEQTLG